MKKWKTHKFLSHVAEMWSADNDWRWTKFGRSAEGYWECSQGCGYRVELSLNPHLSWQSQTTWSVRKGKGEELKHHFSNENWVDALSRLERVFIKDHIAGCGLPPFTEEYACYDGRHGRHLTGRKAYAETWKHIEDKDHKRHSNGDITFIQVEECRLCGERRVGEVLSPSLSSIGI